MMTIHVIFHLNWGCPFSDKLIYLVIHMICIYIYTRDILAGSSWLRIVYQRVFYFSKLVSPQIIVYQLSCNSRPKQLTSAENHIQVRALDQSRSQLD